MRVRCSLGLAGVMAALLARPAGAQEVSVHIEGVVDDAGQTLVLDEHGRQVVLTGEVDALGVHRPRAGRIVRWRDGNGAFVVWRLRAVVIHSGGTARLAIGGDTPMTGGLRIAVGERTRWTHQRAGRPVPETGSLVLAGALASGEPLTFEVALPIRNRDAPVAFHPTLWYAAELNDPVVDLRRGPLELDRLRRQPALPVRMPAPGLPLVPGAASPWPDQGRR